MTINNEQIQALKAAAESCDKQEPLSLVVYHGKMCLRNKGGIVFTVLRDICFPEYSAENENYARLAELCTPDSILSLLADRDADKALIAELKPVAAHAQRGWQEALVEQAMTRIEEQAKSIDFLKEQLAQLANFNPDWDKLEAATDSLREHMAELTEANKRIADTDDALCKLLPGVQYMDPPDGGSVTPLEQVARMVADYRQQIADQAKRIAELEDIRAASERMVRCKGRYHSERNYRALAALFGVSAPDLPPLDSEARTLTVKLPEPLMPAQHNSGELFMTPDDVQQGGYLSRDDVLRVLRKACAAAGITLDVGE